MDEIMEVAQDEMLRKTKSELEKRMMESQESIMNNDWACEHNVDVRSEPLVEILSVRLYNNNNESKGFWEIYGNIYVYDAVKNDSKCYIYELTEEGDYPERVSYRGGSLGLTGPDDVMSMDKPSIFIDIRDTLSGETIISHFAPLEKTVDTGKQDHVFEQFKKLKVLGNSCFAEVEYLALTFGVFAPIEIQIIKQQAAERGSNRLEGEQELEVYGTISASYNLICSENKVNRIMLFDLKNDLNEFEWVRLGRPVIMSRTVVAVPAYSSVTIQLELWDRATKKLIVQGSGNFDASNRQISTIIAGQSVFNAEVTTVWKEPFMLDDQVSKRAVWGLYSHFWPLHAVEVFSIFVGRQSDEQLRLHGLVTFRGGGDRYVLFKRDKDDPYILPLGRYLLPLVGPNEFLTTGDTFNMSVDLEDVDGRVSIKGFAQSSYGLDDHEGNWFDRLLCSVVKGESERSFAAIHYTVFGNASKVTLKVQFFFKGEHSSEDFSKIYGSLIALYDKYGSRTSYETLYFRNVLFERREENPLEVQCTNFDMDLSKSVFAAPRDSPLNIVVDLSCLSTHFSGSLKETRQFHIGSGVCDDHVIEGDKFGIVISVV